MYAGKSYSKTRMIEGCLETAYDVIKKLPLGKLRLVSDINDRLEIKRNC